jgi:hypothetical protein
MELLDESMGLFGTPMATSPDGEPMETRIGLLAGAIFVALHVVGVALAYDFHRKRRRAYFAPNKAVWIGPIAAWEEGTEDAIEDPSHMRGREEWETGMRKYICDRVNTIISKAAKGANATSTTEGSPDRSQRRKLDADRHVRCLYVWTADEAKSVVSRGTQVTATRPMGYISRCLLLARKSLGESAGWLEDKDAHMCAWPGASLIS